MAFPNLLLTFLLAAPAHGAEITIHPGSGVVEDLAYFRMWGDPQWTGSTVRVDPYGLAVAQDAEGNFYGAAYFPLTFISGHTIVAVTICYTTPLVGDSIWFELTENDLSLSVLYADPSYSRSSTSGQCDTQAVNVKATKALMLTVFLSLYDEAWIGSIALTTSK